MKAVFSIVLLICSVCFGASRMCGFIESLNMVIVANPETWPFYNWEADSSGWIASSEYVVMATATDSYGNRINGNHFNICIYNFSRTVLPNCSGAVVILSSMDGSSGGWLSLMCPANGNGEAKFKVMTFFGECPSPTKIYQYDNYRVWIHKTETDYEGSGVWWKSRYYQPLGAMAQLFMGLPIEGEPMASASAMSISQPEIDANGIEWPDMVAGYFDVLDANTARDLKSYTVSFEADGGETIPIFIIGKDANGVAVKTFCAAHKTSDTYTTDRFFPYTTDDRQVFTDANGITHRTAYTASTLDIELIRLQDFFCHWLEAGGDYDFDKSGRVDFGDYAILTRNMN